MGNELGGRVCLVTGASRGIGASVAVSMARAGCRVAINYNSNADKALEVVKKVVDAGGEAIAVQADIRDTDSVNTMIKTIVERWQKLDILVNNAGITADMLLLRMSEKAWDDVIDTNLRGAFLCTRQALRYMLRNDWGRVINIASVAGLVGNIGQANYAASKAGLIAFTKSVAKEVGSHNITANAIAPGFVVTEMTGRLADNNRDFILNRVPLKRLGTPDDIAEVVKFLCGSGAGYITGQVITVDGGLSIS